MRFATGYKPEDVVIPKRFLEIKTGKGPMDAAYMASLQEGYAKAIRTLGGQETAVNTPAKEQAA